MQVDAFCHRRDQPLRSSGCTSRPRRRSSPASCAAIGSSSCSTRSTTSASRMFSCRHSCTSASRSSSRRCSASSRSPATARAIRSTARAFRPGPRGSLPPFRHQSHDWTFGPFTFGVVRRRHLSALHDNCSGVPQRLEHALGVLGPGRVAWSRRRESLPRSQGLEVGVQPAAGARGPSGRTSSAPRARAGRWSRSGGWPGAWVGRAAARPGLPGRAPSAARGGSSSRPRGRGLPPPPGAEPRSLRRGSSRERGPAPPCGRTTASRLRVPHRRRRAAPSCPPP